MEAAEKEYQEWATNLPSAQDGLEALLDALMSRMLSVTEAPVGAILLHEGGELQLAASRGVDAAALAPEELSLRDSPVAPLLETKGSAYVPDLAAISRPDGYARSAGLRSALLAALRSNDELIGVAGVVTREVRRFSPAQRARFEALADRAAAAIDNARLYEAMRRRARQLEVLAGLSAAISAEMDAQALSDLVADAACRLVGADYCALVRLAPGGERDDYAFAALHTRDLLPPPEALRHGGKLLPMLLEGGAPLRIPDTRAHPEAERHGLGELPYRSVLAYPLVWDGRTRAALVLAKERRRAFSEADEEFVRLLTAQACVAFHNGSLLEELRQRGEIAQQRSHLLETLVGSIADPVFIGAPPGVIVDMNHRALEIMGVEGDGVTRSVSEYSGLVEPRYPGGDHMPLEEQPLMRALAGETFDSLEVTFHRAGEAHGDADVTYSFSGAPVHNALGEIILAVVVGHDVTGEHKLRRAQEELMSVASHELKTPLTLVKANAQMLARSIKALDEPKLMQRCLALGAQVDRMQRLVDLLLDISRLETGRLTVERAPLDLAGLVRETVESHNVARPERPVAVRLPAGSVWVEGDRLRLEQVLANLLGNALRYSPDDREMRVELAREGGRARVSVTDQGMGIPAEDLERIFDRFYQVKDSPGALSGSMGMGLYISRGIIGAHGGDIWAESQLGRGSTFHFTLPLVDADVSS